MFSLDPFQEVIMSFTVYIWSSHDFSFSKGVSLIFHVVFLAYDFYLFLLKWNHASRDLSFNKLSGQIPISFQDFPFLQYL